MLSNDIKTIQAVHNRYTAREWEHHDMIAKHLCLQVLQDSAPIYSRDDKEMDSAI